MPYAQEINEQNKALLVFLLDQSCSMEEPLGNSNEAKKDVLTQAINSWLENLVVRLTGSEGAKDWIDVGVIGYGTDMIGEPVIQSPLGGELVGKQCVSIAEIASKPWRIDQRVQSLVDEETGEVVKVTVRVPVWLEIKPEGATPMCAALHEAYSLCKSWIEEHPRSFPPLVINITDGESNDGDPIDFADSLTSMETQGGNLLVLNCHLSAGPSDSFLFPCSDELLPDRLARDLFRMSSVLPDCIHETAQTEGFDLQPGARGMVFNADHESLNRFLQLLMNVVFSKLR